MKFLQLLAIILVIALSHQAATITYVMNGDSQAPASPDDLAADTTLVIACDGSNATFDLEKAAAEILAIEGGATTPANLVAIKFDLSLCTDYNKGTPAAWATSSFDAFTGLLDLTFKLKTDAYVEADIFDTDVLKGFLKVSTVTLDISMAPEIEALTTIITGLQNMPEFVNANLIVNADNTGSNTLPDAQIEAWKTMGTATLSSYSLDLFFNTDCAGSITTYDAAQSDKCFVTIDVTPLAIASGCTGDHVMTATVTNNDGSTTAASGLTWTLKEDNVADTDSLLTTSGTNDITGTIATASFIDDVAYTVDVQYKTITKTFTLDVTECFPDTNTGGDNTDGEDGEMDGETDDNTNSGGDGTNNGGDNTNNGGDNNNNGGDDNDDEKKKDSSSMVLKVSALVLLALLC